MCAGLAARVGEVGVGRRAAAAEGAEVRGRESEEGEERMVASRSLLLVVRSFMMGIETVSYNSRPCFSS